MKRAKKHNIAPVIHNNFFLRTRLPQNHFFQCRINLVNIAFLSDIRDKHYPMTIADTIRSLLACILTSHKNSLGNTT